MHHYKNERPDDVGEIDVQPLFPGHPPGGEPVADHKDKESPDAQQYQRMAIKAVPKAFHGAQCFVLPNCVSPHISDAAFIQVANRLVMCPVTIGPAMVGCKGQNPAYTANNEIQLSGSEERTVPTVMKDDKNTGQKSCCQDGDGQGKPKGDIQGINHQNP